MFKKTLFLAVSLALTLVSVAQANSTSSDACAAYCDYICRQYKSDLKPVELRLSKRNAGDFFVYTLAARVQNVGSQSVGPTSGKRSLKIAASFMGTQSHSIQGAFAPGESRWVGLGRVNPNVVSHCSDFKIHIDSDRQYGQFGCVVYGNDKRIMKVIEAGKKPNCQ